ncbi:MAG: flagellar biosynthetic protein FliO [Lachnospiraceae bacterium]|nr:flagellar biosynthetic protein FliO [Lachnospiraceae bacterium]
MLLTGFSTINSIAQFFTILVIFLFVLGITYFATRFVAKYQKDSMVSGNMEVLESLRLGNGKVLQLVRAVDKYFVIALGKDTVTMLVEVDSAQIQKVEMQDGKPLDFKEILSNAKNSLNGK